MTERWIPAAQAAERLGVSRATLYAYVSRGMVRSEAGPDGRQRRYRTDDIVGLVKKRSVGRRPERIANRALHGGAPVLESGLTLIADNRLYYRGRDAALLAREASLEDVARLLWRCDADPFGPRNLPPETAALRQARRAAQALPALERCRAMLPFAAVADDRAWVADPSIRQGTGARTLRLLAASVAGRPADQAPAHEVLARAWRVRGRTVSVLRAALVLCADHELNASTFAGRVVGSTGATVYDTVLAGLSALNGPRHGGMTRRVAALWDSLAGERDLKRAVAERVRSGMRIPGVGHGLYPEGDPRAKALLEMLDECLADHPARLFARRLADAIVAVIDRPPNVDFALVTVARCLSLPDGSALALFLVGRSVGWIAHYLEQAESEILIRPRAHYVGPPPGA
jgi:citrate synthase